MHDYDRYLFPGGSALGYAARRVMRAVRHRAPAVADRLAPLKRRWIDGVGAQQQRERSVQSGEHGATAAAPIEAALEPELSAARATLSRAAPIERELLRDTWPALRIAHVVGGLAPGGAERQLVAAATGLSERGAAVCEVIVTDDPGSPRGAYRTRLAAAGIVPTRAGDRFDPRFAARLREEPALRAAAASIPAQLRPRCADLFGELVARRPHVVHCWLDHTNIWGGVAAALAGVPAIVLSTRSLAPWRFPLLFEPWFAPWYRALAQRPGVLLVNNSEPGAADYAAWLGVPRSAFDVVLNGVDLAAMRPPSPAAVQAFRASVGAAGTREDGDPILAGVFRIGEEKRPELFVAVADALLARFRRLQVVVAGSGPLEAQMRRQVRASGHASRFHLLGRRDDIPTVLASSSLLLLTSRVEGTPNVLIEAQHFGCPVVTTAAGGAVDAVLDGATGHVRAVDDRDALLGACAALLSDPDARRRFGEAGPPFVAERFGIARMIDQTVELYRRALAAAMGR